MNSTVAPPSRFPRLLRGLWLVLVVALTLEVAARLEDWIRYGASPLQNYTFDQMFRMTANGPRGVPHGRYMRWELNSYGLHGPEITPEPGTVGVIVFGASEPFGIYEDEGKEFPRVLERDLNSRTEPGRFFVVNAAMPGITPRVGLGLVRELQAHVHARILEIHPTPTQYIGSTQPFCSKPIKYNASNHFAWPESRVLGKLTEKVKGVIPASLLTVARRYWTTWQLGDRPPLQVVSPQSLEALAADIHCEVRTARELGMIPVIVTHPDRFGTTKHADDADRLVAWRLQYPILEESGFIDLESRANVVIRDTARAEGVTLVDAAERMSGHSELFADHAHMTNAGSAMMGSLLAPAILGAYSSAQQAAVAGNAGVSQNARTTQ